jgi:hypothetical protein
VHDFVQQILAIDKKAAVVVLGDLNDYPIASYQVIHINAEFTNQTSDHDPQVVRLTP